MFKKQETIVELLFFLPTSINSLIIDEDTNPVESYTLDGRRISHLKRGIVIIRDKYGKTKKTFVK